MGAKGDVTISIRHEQKTDWEMPTFPKSLLLQHDHHGVIDQFSDPMCQQEIQLYKKG